METVQEWKPSSRVRDRVITFRGGNERTIFLSRLGADEIGMPDLQRLAPKVHDELMFGEPSALLIYNIFRLLNEQGMRVIHLAHASGIHRNALMSFFRGSTSLNLSNVAAIRRAFQVEMIDLFQSPMPNRAAEPMAVKNQRTLAKEIVARERIELLKELDELDMQIKGRIEAAKRRISELEMAEKT